MKQELTPKQKSVLSLLVLGYSINATASKTGVSQNTIDAWLRQPDFKKALRDESDRVYQQSLIKIINLVDEAANVLSEILNSGSDKDKLTAVRLVLDNAHKWRDNQLEQRVLDIEQRLGLHETTTCSNRETC